MSIDSRVSTDSSTLASASPGASPAGIDPRGPRFAAWATTGVLAAALLTGSGWLLVAQAAVFATGVFLGPRNSPYGLMYRRFIAPRLSPPTELESEAPPRFAQAVGLVAEREHRDAPALGRRHVDVVSAGRGGHDRPQGGGGLHELVVDPMAQADPEDIYVRDLAEQLARGEIGQREVAALLQPLGR